MTAMLQKPAALKVTTTAALLNNVSGLDHAEIMALAAVGENLPDGEQFAPSYSVHQDIKAAGFTQLAAKLAMRGLQQRGFIVGQHYSSQWSNDEEMFGYELTEKGWEWIVQNRDRFVLKRDKSSRGEPFSDDIPF